MVLSSSAKGAFYQATLNQPVVLQVGDLVLQDGNQISIVRNGVIVATRTFGPATLADTAATSVESISKVVFFRSNPVAGQSVVLVSVTENPATGVIRFRYSNGNEREYANWADVGVQRGPMDQEPALAEDILAYKSFVNSPDGTNKTTMLDVNCAVNFEAGTPIALIEN